VRTLRRFLSMVGGGWRIDAIKCGPSLVDEPIASAKTVRPLGPTLHSLNGEDVFVLFMFQLHGSG